MRIIIIAIGIFAAASVVAQEDSCGVVLERAAANISYRFGTATSASTQANALCDERYEKMSSSEQQGLDASYKLFSASYSTGSSYLKEYRSKYCSSGRSSFFASSQSTDYSSQVYDASVAAWRDCKQMQTANVLISPARSPDDRGVTVSIAYRGPGNAQLTGVMIQPALSFSCTNVGSASIVGPIAVPLSNDFKSFQCTRNVRSGIGVGEYSADGATITITTSATPRPFMMYFPPVSSPDIQVTTASALQQNINELQRRMQALSRGRVVALRGTSQSKSEAPFTASDVLANSLLASSPVNSSITLPVSGDYSASSNIAVCATGSTEYIQSHILLNSRKISSATNRAQECGSATATVSFTAKRGDTLLGMCNTNQGITATCELFLTLVQQRD